MGATRIQGIAQRLQTSDPADTPAQREVFECLRDLRAAFDGPSDPEIQRCLEAASMLVEYLARMGNMAGEDVRAIAIRLLERAASIDGQKDAAPAPTPSVPGPASKMHFIRAGQTAAALPHGPGKLEVPSTEAQEAQPSTTDLMADMMLGQILLARGQILEEHIHQAMKVQRGTGMRIGDVLAKIGAATRVQVADALSYQASCRRVRENLGGTQAGATKPNETRGTGLKLMGEVLLGEVLIERGIITRRQLERALEVQKQSGIRVGEALVKIGAASLENIEQALRVQSQDRKFSLKPPSGSSERKG